MKFFVVKKNLSDKLDYMNSPMTQTNNQTGEMEVGNLVILFRNQLKNHISDYYKMQTENGQSCFKTTLKKHLEVIEQLIRNDDIDLTTQILKKTCDHKKYKQRPSLVVGRLKEVTTWMKNYRTTEYERIFSQIQQMQQQLHQLQQSQQASRDENRQLHQETRFATLQQLREQEQRHEQRHLDNLRWQTEMLSEIRRIGTQVQSIDARLRAVETNRQFHDVNNGDEIVLDD